MSFLRPADAVRTSIESHEEMGEHLLASELNIHTFLDIILYSYVQCESRRYILVNCL